MVIYLGRQSLRLTQWSYHVCLDDVSFPPLGGGEDMTDFNQESVAKVTGCPCSDLLLQMRCCLAIRFILLLFCCPWGRKLWTAYIHTERTSRRGPWMAFRNWPKLPDEKTAKIKSLVTLTAMRKGILPKNLIKSGEEGGRTLPQSRHHMRPQPGWSLKAAFWDSE